MDENVISNKVIGAAIAVHKELGPGLLEAVYKQCMIKELELAGLAVETEVPMRARYRGMEIDVAYRIDMLVQQEVVIELNVVESILAVHRAQLLSYLRLSGKRLGLLLNFNVPVMRSGVRRVVNQL